MFNLIVAYYIIWGITGLILAFWSPNPSVNAVCSIFSIIIPGILTGAPMFYEYAVSIEPFWWILIVILTIGAFLFLIVVCGSETYLEVSFENGFVNVAIFRGFSLMGYIITFIGFSFCCCGISILYNYIVSLF